MVRSPSCPRCDYNLSGVIDSWRDACPLEGVCSECGLGVRWAEILNSRLTLPFWSFEHAQRQRPFALARTLCRAIMPGSLWRELRMEHPVRIRRLLAAAAIGVAATWLGVAVAVWLVISGLEYFVWVNFGLSVRSLLRYLVFSDRVQLTRGSSTIWLWVAAAAWCLVPAGVLVLPVTLKRAEVRPGHILRIWAYGLVSLPLVMGSWWLIDIQVVLRQVAERQFGWRWSRVEPEWRVYVLVTVVVLTMTLGWRSACRKYLRLSHATGVAVASVVIAWGLALVAASLIPGVGAGLFMDW
jgi:hypothetical protein